MIIAGYDTDDLTNRQNYIFNILNHNSINGINMFALNFLSYCIRENFRNNQFNNYEGDCNYLLKVKPDILIKYGIDLNTLYD